MRRESWRRRLPVGVAIAALLLAAGCRKDGGRPVTDHNPRGFDINEFAEWVADMAAGNHRDSLYVFYPDILKADSIAYNPTGRPIKVKDLGNGLYELDYGNGLRLTVRQDQEGNLTVESSRGLFAFDPARKAIAERSGLLTDTLSDVEAAARMKDEGFFAYLEDRTKIKWTDILQISQAAGGAAGEVAVYNLTDYEVDGGDYTVALYIQSSENGQEESRLANEPGKTIAPKDTVHVSLPVGDQQTVRVTGIKFKLSQEELAEKYAPLTGNEYREYLERNPRP